MKVQGGEINQALYAHMNNKRKKKKKKKEINNKLKKKKKKKKTKMKVQYGHNVRPC
jgi:hypothetical protein